MRWRASWLVIAIGGIALLLVGGGLYVASGRRHAAPTAVPAASGSVPQGAAWVIPSGTLSQDDEKGLRAALSGLRLTPPQDTGIVVTSARIDGDWAVLTGQEQVKVESALQSAAAIEFLGHKTTQGWQLVTPGDPEFCTVLRSAPDSITDKDYYIGCRNP